MSTQSTPAVTPRVVRNNTRDIVDSHGIVHKCALHSESWTPLKLKEKMPSSTPIIWIFRFELPNPTDHLGLFGGQYVRKRKIIFKLMILNYLNEKRREEEILLLNYLC